MPRAPVGERVIVRVHRQSLPATARSDPVTSRINPLGQLLKERREQLGYSRTRASQLSGVNASSIESWESGRVSKPPIHDVVRLARVLSISMSELERAVVHEEEAETFVDDLPGTPLDATAASNAAAFGAPLLARALAVLRWTDAEAASALGTSPARVARLRAGEEELSNLEVLTLTAVLAAFPGGAPGDVDELRARVAGARAGR